MFVNAILYQEVLIFDEKHKKFFRRRYLCDSPVERHVRFCIKAAGIKSRLMSEPQRPDESSSPTYASSPAAAANKEIFASKPAEGGGIPPMAWGIAGLAVLAVVVALVLAGRHKSAGPATLQPLAAYAASLPLSQVAMSESTSLSGGKSTFIDGHIQNTGSQTVTGITVQVIFRNDEAMPPQIDTVPLSLIRTREPYIDTQSVGSSPLKAGDGRDFRLIFESIPANWNTQIPEIRIIQVDAK
jgi:uncharacterized protein DUF2393